MPNTIEYPAEFPRLLKTLTQYLVGKNLVQEGEQSESDVTQLLNNALAEMGKMPGEGNWLTYDELNQVASIVVRNISVAIECKLPPIVEKNLEKVATPTPTSIWEGFRIKNEMMPSPPVQHQSFPYPAVQYQPFPYPATNQPPASNHPLLPQHQLNYIRKKDQPPYQQNTWVLRNTRLEPINPEILSQKTKDRFKDVRVYQPYINDDAFMREVAEASLKEVMGGKGGQVNTDQLSKLLKNVERHMMNALEKDSVNPPQRRKKAPGPVRSRLSREECREANNPLGRQSPNPKTRDFIANPIPATPTLPKFEASNWVRFAEPKAQNQGRGDRH